MKGHASQPAVWAFLELLNGRVATASLEVLSEARRLAAQQGLPLCGVGCCSKADTEVMSEEAREYGATALMAIPAGDIGADATFAASVLAPVVHERRPRLVLFSATVLGRELAGRVAARNQLPMAGCASFFRWRDEELVVTHPDHQDRVSVRVVVPGPRTLVATVKAGVFPATPTSGPTAPFDLEVLGVPSSVARGPAVLEQVADVAADMALDEVDVVVAGGVGLRGPGGFDLLGQLADALNGRVAASRLAVDKGWIDKDHMVGQTGATVRPQLYIACGISGAMQHVAGMKDSRTIVAINTDPNAPIRKVADLMLVGDLHQIIPAMIDRIRARKQTDQPSGRQ